jgi:hypothetical protein
MTMRKETYEAMGWGSLLVACIGAIFFPGSRIAGIITLITWGVVIVARARRPLRRKSNLQSKKISN